MRGEDRQDERGSISHGVDEGIAGATQYTLKDSCFRIL